MASPEQIDTLRENLSRVILDQLTEAILDLPTLGSLTNPVLRFEAFLQDGHAASPEQQQQQQQQSHRHASPVVSKMVDLSGYMTPTAARTPASTSASVSTSGPQTEPSPTPSFVLPPPRPRDPSSPMNQLSFRSTASLPLPLPTPSNNNNNRVDRDGDMSMNHDPVNRRGTSGLRPARGGPASSRIPVLDGPDSQRQMQVAEHFPKRAKVQHEDVVFVPQQSSLDKLVISIWEQIHGGISLDPESLLEQWLLTASAATATINNANRLENSNSSSSSASASAPPTPASAAAAAAASSSQSQSHPPSLAPLNGQPQQQPQHEIGLLSAPLPADVELRHLDVESFTQSNVFCRKITQASRACRSMEVIVQARWIEHFDAHVERLALSRSTLSPTKRRKAALVEACGDFGWSEKELRNKMAIWRGYKEIKDAGGWAALVFAGMGLYRFCKYRVGFAPEALARLRALRARLEVAADTLHPTWRRLLAVVGENTGRRYCGHPHDWVVRADGSVDPVPLRSTYLENDPYFAFEHLTESVVDGAAWGSEDDPRWVPPPPAAAACVTGAHLCRVCGNEQSLDPRLNACYCFPSLFGGAGPSHRRGAFPVQVFRTTDGRNNGLLALCPFERGAAVGEFVGVITRGLRDVDVLDSSTGVRSYQIWQGRQGNFTRFVNHSCKANAQLQHFVWLSTQRIVLVSKGIEAGQEITVDYTENYWRGLDKRCLCGESCCRYRNRG